MAAYDESVQNLQRFLVLLSGATNALGQVTQHVEEETQTLDGMEKQAAEDGDGLSGDLQEAHSALETGAAEVTEALSDVGTAATEGQQALGGAQDELDQAASDLEEKAHTALTAVGDADTSLTDAGFQALGHTLDEAEQELQQELQDATQAIDEMEAAVKAMETAAQAACDEAEHELESAASELGEAVSKVEAEGAEGVQAFEVAAGEMESRCTSLEGDLEVIYESLVSGVEAQGHEWEQAVQGAVQDGVAFVADGRQERLDDPAAALETEALGALDHEYEALSALLSTAGAVADELMPLAHELVPCEAVVAKVGQLMDALAG
jgi:chromosome segregation ATPase